MSRPILASAWRPWDNPPFDRYAPAYPSQSYVPLGASADEVQTILDRPKALSWIGSKQGFVMHLKPGIVRSNSEHSACTEGFTTPGEKSVRTDRVSWVAYGAQFRLPEVHPSGLGDVIALNAQFQVHEAKDPNFLVIVSAIRYMDNSAILQVETRASGIVAQVPIDGAFSEVHFLHDSSAGNLSIQHDGQQLVRINRVVPSVAFRVNVGRRANIQILRQGFVEASLCSDLRWLQDPIEQKWRDLSAVPFVAGVHEQPVGYATFGGTFGGVEITSVLNDLSFTDKTGFAAFSGAFSGEIAVTEALVEVFPEPEVSGLAVFRGEVKDVYIRRAIE